MGINWITVNAICALLLDPKTISTKKKVRKGTSKYKGVYFDKRRKRYIAEAKLNGKRIFQKSFRTEIEAAKAYDEIAKKHFGEFASTNFG